VRLAATDAERHGRTVAEWVLDAGNPHLEWLYLGDRMRALDSIAAALASNRSELWIGHVTAALDDERSIGGFLALPGRELAHRRSAYLADLIRSTPRAQRAELGRRLALGKDLYLPVDPDHRFLSKIGLLPPYRGRGLGAMLLDAFISESWEAGYTDIRLDANGTDPKLLRFYTSHGFQVIGARMLEPLNVEYVAMILTRR
jgi:GNAT superfamily N-acetyltransferase